MGSLAKRLFFVLIASIVLIFMNALHASGQATRRTVGTGSFNTKNVWDCNCVPSAGENIIIRSGHKVTLVGNTSMRDLTIQFGGTIIDNGRKATISGNLIVQGSYISSGELALVGSNTSIDWAGLSSSSSNVSITGNKTIVTGTVLSKTGGNIVIEANTTVTNNGSLTLGGSIISSSSTAKWINGAGSTLSVGGSILADGGELDASAIGNTVIYESQTPVVVKAPVNGQYHNLSFHGSGLKVLSSSIIRIRGSYYNGSTVDPSAGTVVFNGTTNIMGTVPPSFHNIMIEEFAAVNAFPGEMSVSGNFTENGSFYPNGGEILFAGTAGPSLINGTSEVTSFERITVLNSHGVFNEKNIEIYDGLNVGPNASFFANGGGTGRTTLKSLYEFTGDDAYVGPLLGGAKVIGNVVVERHVTPVSKIYRYLSSPVKTATVRDWSDDFLITGNIPGLKKTTLCGVSVSPTSTSLYYYNESAPGVYGNGYVAYPESTAQGLNAPLIPGRGYAAYVRNCNSLTVDVEGEINSGDVSFDFITWTPSGDQSDGYNLVGNPYPSSIDWASESGWTRSNVSSVVAVTNNKSGQTQFTYLDALESSSPQLIATGQAFWIQTTGPTPELIIHEQAKSTGGGEFFRESSADQLIISLATSDVTDKAYVKLRGFASRGRDEFDGLKLKNSTIDIYTISEDGVEMAINSTPALACSGPIRIGIRNVKPGAYSLAVERLGRLARFSAVIYDAYLDKKIAISDRYEFEVNSDPGSSATERFSLYTTSDEIASPSVEIDHEVCGGDAAVSIIDVVAGDVYNVYNESDSLIFSVEAEKSELTFSIAGKIILPGENLFRIQHHGVCGNEAILFSIEHANKPADFDVKGEVVCDEGTATLSVYGAEQTDRVLWFKSSEQGESVHEGAIFETPVIGKSESWFVQLVNTQGCESEKREVRAEVVKNIPPVISQEGTQLRSSIDSTFWYLNGEFLGTSREIILQGDGTYVAEVRNGGCSARVETTVIIASSEVAAPDLAVYPNPTDDYFILQAAGVPHHVRLFNQQGQIFHPKEISQTDNRCTFDITSLPPGVYVVQFYSQGLLNVSKLVKR